MGSTAVIHHINIVRFAWMEYRKMRKILSQSFCLCSWFKRLRMSFGKEFRHEVPILQFKGWFLVQKLARGL